MVTIIAILCGAHFKGALATCGPRTVCSITLICGKRSNYRKSVHELNWFNTKKTTYTNRGWGKLMARADFLLARSVFWTKTRNYLDKMKFFWQGQFRTISLLNMGKAKLNYREDLFFRDHHDFERKIVLLYVAISKKNIFTSIRHGTKLIKNVLDILAYLQKKVCHPCTNILLKQ